MSTNKIKLLGQLLMASLVLANLAAPVWSQGSVTRKTDRAIYPQPTAPRLPAAGGTFTDPTFGTEIMRVTDERNAEEGGTYYSYWPTFNCDSTKLLVRTGKDSSASIFSFNPDTFTLGGRSGVPRGPNGAFGAEGAMWSAKDPDTLYVFSGMSLYAYHPTAKKSELIVDLSKKFYGDFPWQPSMSADDDVFAFSRRRPNNSGGSDYVGYTVYRRSTNSVVLDQNVNPGDLDEVQIDKSGRWLIVKGETKTTKGFSIRDLNQDGARSQLGAGPPDYALGHSDNGSTFVAGFNNYLNTVDRRNFVSPGKLVTTFKLNNDWSQGMHISLLGKDESWMLVSLYLVKPKSPGSGPFHNEILLVKTDGTERIRRLVHHHSLYREYWDTPRATISRDGKFVAFTSNWGGRARRDLFVARIDMSVSSAPKERPRRVTP